MKGKIENYSQYNKKKNHFSFRIELLLMKLLIVIGDENNL